MSELRAVYTPSPVQAEFHALTVDEAMFGGSAGPGKSFALRADPLDVIVVEHERVRAKEIAKSEGAILYLRRTMPRLEEAIKLAKNFYGQVDPGFKMVDQKSRVIGTFSSGLQVIFAHMKDSDSFMDHRSNSYLRLYFDELIEFERDQYIEMVTRVRSTDPVLSRMLKVRAATNPAPGWVREHFVDPAPHGRTVLKRSMKLDDGSLAERTRIFIPSLLKDNPSAEFRRQYEANLRDKPAHIRAALLNGDWYVVAGAFFADVWDPEKVLLKPFKIPSHWQRFRSMDWGLKSPCVVLWWAVTPDGEMICYRERVFNGPKARRLLSAYEVALEIRDIERTHGEWNEKRGCSRLSGPADTQLWEDRGQRGLTMAQDMAEAGVFWKKATKGRRQAAQQVYKRLKDGTMKFFIVAEYCVTTIPSLGTDQSDPEVPQKGGPDHGYDACSYAAVEHITESEEFPTGARSDDDEPDELESRRRIGKYGFGR